MQVPAYDGTDGRLRRFQDGFARALLAREADGDGEAAVADLVRQPGFSVYRNTVMKGCIDALQANYPAVTRLVGEEWFRAAAAIYARAHPPRHPSLLDYGGNFPQFLAAFEPAAEVPYLFGVARLDRYWTEAHAARDQEPVEAEDVARLAPERLVRTVLRPHAAARWEWFAEHPVFTIWEHNRAPGACANMPEIPWRGEGALVVRPHRAVAWIQVDAAACAFLDACAAGDALAGAAEAALAAEPGVDLTGLMARLLKSGAFGHLAAADETQPESLP